MTPAFLGYLIGGVLAAFIFSRIFRLILKRFLSGYPLTLLQHACSLTFAVIVGGFGMADGGPWVGLLALERYLPFQTFVLAIDLFLERRRSAK